MMPKGVEHRGFAAHAVVFVLNAFRHHRNSHAGGEHAFFFPVSPQRLSASSEFSRRSLVFWASSVAPRAQRLSASSEFSRANMGHNPASHPCSTPFGIIGILTHQY